MKTRYAPLAVIAALTLTAGAASAQDQDRRDNGGHPQHQDKGAAAPAANAQHPAVAPAAAPPQGHYGQPGGAGRPAGAPAAPQGNFPSGSQRPNQFARPAPNPQGAPDQRGPDQRDGRGPRFAPGGPDQRGGYDQRYAPGGRPGGDYGGRGPEYGGRGPDSHDRRTWNYRGRDFQSYQVRPFVYPRGFGYREWGRGERLPLFFLTAPYFLTDFYDYQLPPPPYGFVWVRYGPDALLVNRYTGEVIDEVYGIFYW